MQDITIANKSGGKYGLQVLASVVIACESNSFVLTTTSNLSRLINEIRIGIIDANYGHGKTMMIDLQSGEWRK